MAIVSALWLGPWTASGQTSALESAESAVVVEAPDESTQGGTNALPESSLSPRGSGMPDFPPRLEEPSDFDQALDAIRNRRQELQQALDLAEDGSAPPETRALNRSRIQALDELKLIVQRDRTQQSRLVEVREMAEQRTAQQEMDANSEPVTGPVPLTQLDELRSDRAVLRRERDATEVSLDRIAQQIKSAEAELAAAQAVRRQAQLEQDQAAETSDAAANFELSRLEELEAAYRLATLRTQREVARQELELLKSRLASLNQQIDQAVPRVQFSTEALAEKLNEIDADRAELEQALDKLRQQRDVQESTLYDARSSLQQADADEARRAELADQVAAKEAQLEAASRGIEYLEKQLEYNTLRRQLWKRRHTLMAGAGDEDADTWLNQTRERLHALEQERDIVEARLNALRQTQLELQDRLANPASLNGHEPSIRERVGALEQQETRGERMLAAIARVESVAQRLERQLVDRTDTQDWRRTWEQTVDLVTGLWRYELFVMEDEVLVSGEPVIKERAFTVGRTVVGLAVLAGVFFLGWMIRGLLSRFVLPRLVGDRQHPRDLAHDLVVALVRNTSTLFLLVIALWSAAGTLPWRGVLHEVLRGALIVAVWCQIGLWGSAVLGRVLQRNRLRREEADPASLSAYGLLGFFGQVAIWIIVALTILWALDYQIAPLIGALGVGGIAVAFALQSILADIFNSMAIILDKPFRVGDFIIVGDTLGTVEQIGIKTTRIRSLSGEQIILTNSDLLGSRIRNYKRMLERRVVFQFGVVYQTPVELLERIPSMVEDIITGIERSRFDRAHFLAYGDFSLNFEVVYYVIGSDYTLYMDIQQAINLALYRRFEEHGIEFAYPTQSIIVQRNAPSSAPALQPAYDSHS